MVEFNKNHRNRQRVGFRHIDVHDAGPIVIGNPKRAPHHLLNAIERRGDAAPFRHRFDDADLIEILIRAAAIGIADAGAPRAGDEQNAIASPFSTATPASALATPGPLLAIATPGLPINLA